MLTGVGPNSSTLRPWKTLSCLQYHICTTHSHSRHTSSYRRP